jgi:hypothetical protein
VRILNFVNGNPREIFFGNKKEGEKINLVGVMERLGSHLMDGGSKMQQLSGILNTYSQLKAISP